MFLVSVHSHSTFCSNLMAEIGVSYHYLGENQGNFIGCSLNASLSAAFALALGVTNTLLQVVFASTPAPALPVKCLQHRCIQAGFIELVLILDQFSCVSPDLAV